MHLKHCLTVHDMISMGCHLVFLEVVQSGIINKLKGTASICIKGGGLEKKYIEINQVRKDSP